jgi:hypothetical protein
MNNETSTTKRRLKTQMKAIRMASSYLVSVGAGGNSTWQEFSNELQQLKAEYRYVTYEENHGSLAAEMVVGGVAV